MPFECHRYLGEFCHCDFIQTGLYFQVDGSHRINLEFGNGVLSWLIPGIADQQIEIDANFLQEYSSYFLKIENPDGTPYERYDLNQVYADEIIFTFDITQCIEPFNLWRSYANY